MRHAYVRCTVHVGVMSSPRDAHRHAPALHTRCFAIRERIHAASPPPRRGVGGLPWLATIRRPRRWHAVGNWRAREEEAVVEDALAQSQELRLLAWATPEDSLVDIHVAVDSRMVLHTVDSPYEGAAVGSRTQDGGAWEARPRSPSASSRIRTMDDHNIRTRRWLLWRSASPPMHQALPHRRRRPAPRQRRSRGMRVARARSKLAGLPSAAGDCPRLI